MTDQHQHQSPAGEDHAPEPVASFALPFFLALLLLCGIGYGGWTWWRVQQAEWASAQAIDDPIGPPLTEFEFTERDGQTFRSADMRGRVWVATYFFTTCPGSCIRLNENIQYMHRLPELKEVTWVSITCDPDNDTPEVLRDYAARWEADPERWLFCRAELDYTQRVARGMNLFLSYKGHQDRVVVIDKTGQIRGLIDATSKTECQRLHTLLVKLLEEAPADASADTAAQKTPT
jgi:cytochrome oxidase Cu insertion factor (SCO1/SenC/PrrC family)